MKMIRKTALAALVLGGVVGCAGEPESAPVPVMPKNPPAVKKDIPAPSPAKTEPAPGKEEPKKDSPPKVEGPKTGSAERAPGAITLTADELAEIKKLPAEDQEAAIKQAVCPVSDEHLGEMGTPVKVSAAGRSFFLCCNNCQKDVKANPQAVIAKLDKK
jgi:hypothetical protein